MKLLLASALLVFAVCFSACCLPNPPASPATVLIVVGAPGEAEYGSNFLQQAQLWAKACAQAGAHEITLGLDAENGTNDFDRLKLILAAEPKAGLSEVWLVLIGHGTFDGKEARFNLRGPDVSATDLAQWMQPFRRPLAVVDGGSCSAPFLGKLSGTNRVVITATRSGHEQNFARFGRYFAEAITDVQADLDKDGQVSLLEAFLTASRRAGEFYKLEGRIATEHALLDDNGDGLGTQADWFRGVRAVKKPKENAMVDGLLAQQFHLIRSQEEQNLTPEQRARRDAIEREVFVLRETKSKMAEGDYYRDLEKLLLELARLSESR